MKKTLITLVLCLITTLSFSQVWAVATNLTIGIRDNVYSKFTWGETRQLSEKILVKLYDRDVFVYTEEVQFYQTLNPEYKTADGRGSYWFAVDQKMKRCKVYLYGEGADILIIEYDDACIMYGLYYK